MKFYQIPPLFLLWTISIFNLIAQEQSFSRAEIASDLAFLKAELEQNHPNLYTYSSIAEIDHWFQEKTKHLPNLITQKEAFRSISSFSALLKDGHSYIYPSAKHLEDFFNTAPLFPLDVFLIDDSLVVVKNYTQEQNIPLGVKLVKINGIEIPFIQATIVQNTCRDGDNLQYPKHLYHKFFAAYYSFFFGFPEKFDITYLNEKGELKEVSVMGIKRAQIKAQKTHDSEKGIDLHLLTKQKSAILSIKSFDKKILKNDYDQHFKKEIKGIFKTIEEKGIRFLVIDLRDNQGGALSNGIYLLQHFMDSSFQCVNSFTVLKKGKRKRLNTKWDNYFKPKRKFYFDGDTYLFINDGSYSCSAIVANTFQQNDRGTILGQMSGGSAFVNSGAPNNEITLPNTKIIVTIPKTQYNLRKDNENMGLGIKPDIEVQDNPNRIIHGVDSFIEKFVELIEEIPYYEN